MNVGSWGKDQVQLTLERLRFLFLLALRLSRTLTKPNLRKSSVASEGITSEVQLCTVHGSTVLRFLVLVTQHEG